jgi:hypothetical protein
MDLPSISDAWDFWQTIKSHLIPGFSIAATLGVLGWLVSKIEAITADADRAPTSLGLLRRLIRQIEQHRYALASNVFLLGIIISAFLAHADLKFRVTPIKLETHDAFSTTENAAPHRTWIRVKATNVGHRLAHCRCYLNDVIKRDNPTPIFRDAKLLLWAAAGGAPEYQKGWVIPPTTWQHFNVASAAPTSAEMSIPSDEWIHIGKPLAPGIYDLRIEVSGPDCGPSFADITIVYRGANDIAVMDRH